MNASPTDRRDDSAGRIVHDRLVELVDRLAICESRIRHQETDGVHKMRVTLRRLRSLLATYGPLFDRDTVTTLREELAWVAGEMAAARDAEVVRRRLNALASSADQRAVAGRIAGELVGGEADAPGLVALLDSERYSRDFHALNAFAAEPPWNPAVDLPTEDTLRDLVHRDWRRVRRRAHRARHVIERTERQAALHEVRKAAKRLRYSAEVLVPLHGRDARRLVARTKRVQKALGELQDSVITRQALRRSADGGEWDSAQRSALDGMHAREKLMAARAEDRYARAWRRLARKKNRQWLT